MGAALSRNLDSVIYIATKQQRLMGGKYGAPSDIRYKAKGRKAMT